MIAEFDQRTLQTYRYSYKIKSSSFYPLTICTGADPEYIHLCKCWSHICGGKIIKKYRYTYFLHQIIFFFSSADRKD